MSTTKVIQFPTRSERLRGRAARDQADKAKREGLSWIDSFLANDARPGQEHGLAFHGKELVAVSAAGEIRPVTISEGLALLAKWHRNVRDGKAEFEGAGDFTAIAGFFDMAARATR